MRKRMCKGGRIKDQKKQDQHMVNGFCGIDHTKSR